jgi:hypothetical protein
MSNTGESVPAKMQEKYDAIRALIEPFCREHLNAEYSAMCARLLATLARKRPSPLLSGKAAAWACGVVRVIGMVNFLHDSTQNPYMKIGAINDAFGVSMATAQGRAKAIRDLLKIGQFDPQWTLPSMMADNPMAWFVQVNGFVSDVRQMPRAIQEQAFERGLIPYIPADRQQEDRSPAAT